MDFYAAFPANVSGLGRGFALFVSVDQMQFGGFELRVANQFKLDDRFIFMQLNITNKPERRLQILRNTPRRHCVTPLEISGIQFARSVTG